MFGPPEPISPHPGPGRSSSGPLSPYFRHGFVSLWAGNFVTVVQAETYFGIPDEIGVYLPPEAFANDFALGNFPLENLEVNFEQVLARPLYDLLSDATYSGSYLDSALSTAESIGMQAAQGVALLFDFDYRHPLQQPVTTSPVQFVGAFPFVPIAPEANLQPYATIADTVGYPLAAVLSVSVALEDVGKDLRDDLGNSNHHISARQICDYLLRCRGPNTAAFLREAGIQRSEDVGRIIHAMIESGLATTHDSDTRSDFQGLFVLENTD